MGPDTAYRRSRISGVDGSCQYYGVLPPSNLTSGKSYALILSLHGAGVEAIQPFTSRMVLPDYMVWAELGVQVGGFFDSLWAYDATLERGALAGA